MKKMLRKEISIGYVLFVEGNIESVEDIMTEGFIDGFLSNNPDSGRISEVEAGEIARTAYVRAEAAAKLMSGRFIMSRIALAVSRDIKPDGEFYQDCCFQRDTYHGWNRERDPFGKDDASRYFDDYTSLEAAADALLPLHEQYITDDENGDPVVKHLNWREYLVWRGIMVEDSIGTYNIGCKEAYMVYAPSDVIITLEQEKILGKTSTGQREHLYKTSEAVRRWVDFHGWFASDNVFPDAPTPFSRLNALAVQLCFDF